MRRGMMVVVAVALAAVAPAGVDSGSTVRMALVQGGGEQGTSALEVPPDVVFERHLAATATIEGPVDVVVWPENVVDVNDLAFADSPHRQAIAAEAAIVAVLDGSICGFVCSGIRGARACYMHGAHLPEARAHYPSDQLFLAMLRAARSASTLS